MNVNDERLGPNLLTKFGGRVRALRVKAGLSQEVLAFKAGLDRTYVSGIERGTRNVSLVNLHKLARALGVSLSELLQNL